MYRGGIGWEGGVSNTTITDINKTRMVLLVVVIQLLLLLLSQLL